MAAKLRVHQLAKELGMTNKETLDLCIAMGIDAKSHSSGIIEAQADRVRRKAEREGLIRDEQPEEPKAAPAKKAAAKKAPAKKAPAKKAPAGTAGAGKAAGTRATDGSAPVEPQAATTATVAGGVGDAGAEPAKVAPAPGSGDGSTSEPAVVATPEQAPSPSPGTDSPQTAALSPQGSNEAAAAEPAEQVRRPNLEAEPAELPRSAPRAAEGSAGGDTATPHLVSNRQDPRRARRTEPGSVSPSPTRPASPGGAVPRPARQEAAPRPETAARSASPSDGSAPARPSAPTSRTGKPIPPPPGPPLSRTGKPIPPPPGAGGRRPSPPERAGRPGGGASRPGGAAPRLGGGGNAPGGAPGGGPGGGPGGRGGPGGGPGGRGRPGGGPRPPRRKGRRRRNREELQPMDLPSYTPQDAAVPEGVVVIERASSPQVLGPKLNRTAADVVRYLMQQGEMVTATHSLSDDMIELFAAEIGAEIELVDPGEEQEVELQRTLDIPFDDDDDADTSPRSPVITVMGHVDHGKTKLLDRIRNANVVAGEAGGITQHIGAYQAHVRDRTLTFLDTPGHEAFTAMRARGADATDIVVLVVAADDGVMPQTIEAIQHARAAEVPIVVAVNKVDRANADPNRVLQQLSEHGLVPEQWGGDTIAVEISALEGLGIDDLLDNLLVVAELEDLRANADGRATGTVLEAHLDVGRGAVATILVERGTLRVGDPLVAGPAWGRVRALINDRGEHVDEAGPSVPVQVLGLSDIASAGDAFVVAPSEKLARQVAETRERWHRERSRGRDSSVMAGGARLEDIFDQIQSGEVATLNLVVKADVQGSLEAVTESLRKLERPEVRVGFVLRGVGGISESDIQLAATANATIIGFNVRPDRKARDLAIEEDVEIRTYEIIYKLLEDIEAAMVGMLAPEFEEVVTGEAEVREVFRVPRVGAVAGCLVQSGVITRGSEVRFLRDGSIIWKGSISSLRRFKDDVREVNSGYECGIGLSDFQDLKAGDVIETFELREVPAT